ncbi:unnamed protein product [Cuscuta epithymum]|uniref:Retrovirus-related Pol polyprotein from transposon TNT 1-94-like beta-barrel domain-containing protein n=1 Tax=Cuscuta epithymum TaxID=186058 RepID=A0AAV0FNI3_9ASTE|nr:unnamed protein product [Cuscuta epithymum]
MHGSPPYRCLHRFPWCRIFLHTPPSLNFLCLIPYRHNSCGSRLVRVYIQQLHDSNPRFHGSNPVQFSLRSHQLRSQSVSNQYYGPSFAGSPGVTRPAHDNPLFGSPMSALAQSVSHGIANVCQIVTIKLKAVEDYLTWRTQFESFLVSQGLFGMVDGTIQVPPMYTLDFNNQRIVNTDYYHWLRVDQTIRSWLFATLTRDVLTDVHDIKHSFGIWARLQSRFMSASLPRAMELKRLLSNTKKKPNQSMESYLRDIKNLTDALAATNSPVTDKELLQSTLSGLGPEYKFVTGTVSLFPESFPPDILHPRLMEAEQQVLHQQQQDASSLQQAFGAQVGAGQQGQGAAYRGRGHRGRGGRGYRGRGGWGYRGRGGRGRNRPQQAYAPPAAHGQFHQPAPRPADAGGVHVPRPPNAASGNSVLSNLNINAKSTSGTHNAYAGFPSAEGILGSVPPPVVCQICFSAGHSALRCPSRYSQPSAPALLAPTGESNDALWYPDSGASAHMTSSEGILSNKSSYSGPMTVSVANGVNLPIANIGNIQLNTLSRPFSLNSVYHVPQIKFNLISIQKLCADNNCIAIFLSKFFSCKGQNFGGGSASGTS